MKRKGNNAHYENSIEAYLIAQNTPYIATNEDKKIAYNNGKIKNFDIILPGKRMLFCDLKGKKWIYSSTPSARWENWILKEDAESLKTWSSVSSDNQQAYLIYAYCSPDSGDCLPASFKENTFYFNNMAYAFFAISIEDYLINAKPRSNIPPTISVSRKLFSSLLRPLHELLKENRI